MTPKQRENFVWYSFASLTVVYLAFRFITLEWDPTLWGLWTRISFLAVAAFGVFMSLGIALPSKGKDGTSDEDKTEL